MGLSDSSEVKSTGYSCRGFCWVPFPAPMSWLTVPGDLGTPTPGLHASGMQVITYSCKKDTYTPKISL